MFRFLAEIAKKQPVEQRSYNRQLVQMLEKVQHLLSMPRLWQVPRNYCDLKESEEVLALY